jgi:OmpA-OmpF porin, OOP family
MIKSAATTSIPDLSSKVLQPMAFGWKRFFFTMVFRLLLLGIGGGSAAVVGVAIAQLYPTQAQEPPSLEKLMQQAQSLLQHSLLQNIGQLLPNNQQSQVAPVSPVSVPAASPTANALSDSERQQLQVEMTELQAELQTLTSQSTEPLADRGQEIQKRIQMVQERLSSFIPQAGTVVPLVSSDINPNHLMVTLPSDALFAAGGTFRPDETILNSILTDLQRYPEAAIQVSAHTDQQNAGSTDQDRSLEQAKAVQQYLSTQLSKEVHWVTIGYGHSRPIVPDDSPENRQRNRRIEILIKP